MEAVLENGDVISLTSSDKIIEGTEFIYANCSYGGVCQCVNCGKLYDKLSSSGRNNAVDFKFCPNCGEKIIK